MTTYAHSVRAWLLGGWHEQPCKSASAASKLFDRLRALNPALTIQRLHLGRAVEIADVGLALAPRTEQQKADDDLVLYGSSFMRDGKRIDPATVYIAPD